MNLAKKVRLFLMIFTMFFSVSVMAMYQQPSTPPSPGSGGYSSDGIPPPYGVPIDKELPYLFVAGIVLGVMFFKKRNI